MKLDLIVAQGQGITEEESRACPPSPLQLISLYDFVPKVHKCRVKFLAVIVLIKSVSNTLSCCCFVCAFIIGQYHSGNNMSSKSGAAGEIVIFKSEKHHGIWPLKTGTLTMSASDAFIHVHDESKHYLSHQSVKQEILLSRVHITLIIIKFWFWS